MSELLKHKPIKPHHESMRPYGYRFEAINLYLLDDFIDSVNLFNELKVDHKVHDIRIGKDCPHRDRIIWEIASHIEGNFGLPYKATIVFSEAHYGDIRIYTPKNDKWWNNDRWSDLSNYLMGLRSLLDILKD